MYETSEYWALRECIRAEAYLKGWDEPAEQEQPSDLDKTCEV